MIGEMNSLVIIGLQISLREFRTEIKDTTFYSNKHNYFC